MRSRRMGAYVGWGSLVVCLSLASCDGGSPEDSSSEGGAGNDSGGARASGGSSAGVGGGDGSGSGGAPGQGSGGQSASGGALGSGGSGPVACSGPPSTLAVKRLDGTRVADLGRPFDPNTQDVVGPTHWSTRYGKTPEIVPVVSEDGLAVLLQDQDSGEVAHVVHVASNGSGYAVDAIYEVGSLGRIMGLTRDTAGNYYVATGVNEDGRVNATYPPDDIHRPDVVRIVKFDTNGCVLMESDVDIERGKRDSSSEIIVNPTVAASSRLAWGGDRLLVVHGHNTEYDAGVDARHQKAISTHVDATTGAVTRTSTMWVSHSFDQRAFFDGTGFVELHLGDAYPRAVTFGRYSDSQAAGEYKIYRIKGATGANVTYTRLGGLVPSADSTFGYLALFATERSTDTGDGEVRGTRDLALVRVRRDFHTSNNNAWVVDQGAGTSEHTVTSAGSSQTNRVRWLTNLGANLHAERPRIVALGNEEFVVLWERWSQNGNQSSYVGTYAMKISGAGAELEAARALSGADHIPRGDDAVAFDGKAVYVTGSGAQKALVLNLVSSSLGYERVVLP